MEKKFLLLTLAMIFLVQLISAICNEGQVDVNSASLEELDGLSGIGPAKAQEIVNSRPFSSIDDLIKVKGIGEVTLSNIKAQDLACVENEEQDEKKESNEDKSIGYETETTMEEPIINNLSSNNEDQEIELQTITLNPLVPKAINTEENKNLKKNAALWGFVVFCVLIAVLFIIKRKRHKNEFR